MGGGGGGGGRALRGGRKHEQEYYEMDLQIQADCKEQICQSRTLARTETRESARMTEQDFIKSRDERESKDD